MSLLHQIQEHVRQRTEETVAAHEDWPCRKGCDECCRRLASIPQVSEEEWQLIAVALEALPRDVAQLARRRIQESESATRPVTCPLLDTGSGTCLVYEARPVACRAYGFYAERREVLGCSRIAAISEERSDVVWGNHAALEERLGVLGSAADLFAWLKPPISR